MLVESTWQSRSALAELGLKPPDFVGMARNDIYERGPCIKTRTTKGGREGLVEWLLALNNQILTVALLPSE